MHRVFPARRQIRRASSLPAGRAVRNFRFGAEFWDSSLQTASEVTYLTSKLRQTGPLTGTRTCTSCLTYKCLHEHVQIQGEKWVLRMIISNSFNSQTTQRALQCTNLELDGTVEPTLPFPLQPKADLRALTSSRKNHTRGLSITIMFSGGAILFPEILMNSDGNRASCVMTSFYSNPIMNIF